MSDLAILSFKSSKSKGKSVNRQCITKKCNSDFHMISRANCCASQFLFPIGQNKHCAQKGNDRWGCEKSQVRKNIKSIIIFLKIKKKDII